MAIYGENDTRIDLYALLPNNFILSRAKSVVLVISVDDLIGEANGAFVPGTQALGERTLIEGSPKVLCKGQRYLTQPSALEAYGSGFLFRDKVIATAKHVVETALEYDPIEKLRFVFDWCMLDANTARQIPAIDIYTARSILAMGPGDSIEDDWALIELTQPVQGRAPLALATEKSEKNTPLFCISHPTLLPLKYSSGWISDLSDPGRIRGPVTAFAGSSGSPVFSEETGNVVGIYVHGPDDYMIKDSCVVACNYSNGDLSDHGKMVRIEQILDRVPPRAPVPIRG